MQWNKFIKCHEIIKYVQLLSFLLRGLIVLHSNTNRFKWHFRIWHRNSVTHWYVYMWPCDEPTISWNWSIFRETVSAIKFNCFPFHSSIFRYILFSGYGYFINIRHMNGPLVYIRKRKKEKKNDVQHPKTNWTINTKKNICRKKRNPQSLCVIFLF